MANSEAVAGIQTWALYGAESTFNSAVAVTTHLGLLQTFRGQISSNLNEHRGFVGTTTGGRKVVKHTPGKLELMPKADFEVINWGFLEYAMGGVSGADPYTYTIATTLPSFTIAHNIDNPGAAATDQEGTWSGTVVNSCSIKAAVGEAVKCNLEMQSALLVIDSTITSAVALPSDDVYDFTGGTIALPAATPLTNIIDSVEFTITNQNKPLYGLGSRLMANNVVGQVDISLKVTLKYLDNALITAALGATTPTADGAPTEYATFELTFANSNRSIVMTFTEVPIGEFAQIHELNEVVGEDLTFNPKSLSCVEDDTE